MPGAAEARTSAAGTFWAASDGTGGDAGGVRRAWVLTTAGDAGDRSWADGGWRGDRGAGERRGVVRSSWRRFRRFFASASCCA